MPDETTSQHQPGINLAECLVVKWDNLFLLSPRDGRLPGGLGHPLGLWYRDCRFLSVHDLRIGGEPLMLLQASDAQGTRAVHHLADRSGSLSVQVERELEGPTRVLERIVLRGHGEEDVPVELALRLGADFAPMLGVRGMVRLPERHAEVAADGGAIRFALRGRDGVLRTTTAEPSGVPVSHASADGEALLRFEIELGRGTASEVVLRYAIAEEEPGAGEAGLARASAPERARRAAPARAGASRTGRTPTAVRTGDELFDRVLRRSLADLALLRSDLGGNPFYAAGVPWFATLFGRDSLISAGQSLAFAPDVAAGTLRALAGMLGRTVDDSRDEEPGKVPHELRVGEPANLGETPFARYYGSADSTPLWLCLLCDHAAWTGDLALFRELRPQVDAALAWLDGHGDLDGDGLIEYRPRAPGGLRNQGWKDSDAGVPDGEGRPLEPPVALVEVQGYAVRALRGVARLLRLDGEHGPAEQLEERAERTAAALERFRIDAQGGYAIGLDGARRPGSPVTSNQGHLLWAGAISPEQAHAVRDVLMGEAMWSGWGIRTLAEGHPGYNPLGYHVGSVWPHDTAMIAAGMRRYGFDADFEAIFEGLLEAASLFPDHRMPELFGGFPRREGDAPVPYPVACRPQAWAAGAIPQLLTAGLGLEPDAPARRLRVVRPLLPPWVETLSVEGLRVGAASVDLRFERAGGQVALARARVEGELRLEAS
jgi:glycogen debranching enzyme